MIEILIDLVKLIVAILPFVALCLASRKVNLGQADRSKQFFMPIVALIYVIVTMLLMNHISEWLLQLIDNIPKWIRSLADISWMPKAIGKFISRFALMIRKLLQELNLNFWIFFIANVAIIAVYMIIKGPVIKIMSKLIKTDGTLHTKIATLFYDYFSEKNTWCLKENYVQARGMLKVFYYSAVTLSALLMLVSRYLYFEGLLRAVFYPVFGVIVVGELFFYLDGTSKREYSKDVLGEDEEAYRVTNYSLLRKFLRSVFGDKLLTENTTVNNALAYDVTVDEIIGELEQSESAEEVNFAAYLEALNRSGFAIDRNYLYSSLDMLNGKSVLFNNPFYNDLIPYAFYPMNRVLLSHRKVLVVLGRHAVEDDIKGWLERGIESVTNIPFLWRIGVLSAEEQDLDIGIITRSDVLDIKLHEANSDFLEKVGYMVIIEPSKLISTAQIGLNLLVKKCKHAENENVVFCMCDKNCDGLVDAMSHVLMTSITEVAATNKPQGTSSYMCWEADEEYLHHRLVPNISRYLGMGTELSFAALKNQVSKTKWFGGDAFPVADISWIDKQYYYDLTRYANLPTDQEAMDEHFLTTSNYWSAEVEKNNYFTVEDEANNMFEILRDFSTRSTEQGFINIISSEYLLKDYMADNASIFETDAKAIPFICADYTRSNRNTVLRLILKMSTFPVSNEILEKEFSLLGIKVFDLKKQIWYEMFNCYSEVSKTSALPEDYKEAVKAVYHMPLQLGDSEWTPSIILVDDSFNIKTGKMETVYSIKDRDFLALCVAELRSAGYVSEDEKGQKYYLGAELCGHIYQKYLPGQFFTFGGKYYEMQYLTADGQVLVRRAADHINGRPSYRQIREYTINDVKPSGKMGSEKDVAGMKITKMFADISVNTTGYFEMDRYNDFTTAKRVTFDGERMKRNYYNKEVIKLELPDYDGMLNDNVRYTVTVLFNEVFKTLFAENQAYICAVTDDSFLAENTESKPLTYSLKGGRYEISKNAIYIIEDSQLDLGLTVAVERNLQRIFGIIQDYLDWHLENLEECLMPQPEPQPPITFVEPTEDGEKPKKKGIFGKMGDGIKKAFDKLKGIFKKKPKKDKDADKTPEDGEKTPEGDIPVTPDVPEAPVKGEVPETTPTDGEQPAEGEAEAAEGEKTEGEEPKKKLTRAEKKQAKKEKKEQKKREKEEKKALKKKEKEEKKAAKNKDKPEKKGAFGWLTGLFKKKKPKEEAEDKVEGEMPENETDTELPAAEKTPVATEDEETEAVEEEETVVSETTDSGDATECPVPEEELREEREKAKAAGFSNERKPYNERYYMLFGGENEMSFIDLSGTFKYLSAMKTNRNALKLARNSKKIAEMVEATFKPGKPDARYCDFCGAEIYGVEFETLADGRDRCLSCSRTAIKTGEEFRKIFEDVKRNMEAFFGIRINTGIKVEMVNSKTLHKRLGKAYVPTPKADGRVLGVAIKDKSGYTLMVENGSPRMASMLTMAHELTHIWQYINWNDKAIRKKYGKKLWLEVYEGMAKWTEIQYAYLINEPATAKREEIITSMRDDEYGHGFLRYKANYPFSTGTVITKKTPFIDIETPLDEEFCGEFTVNLPTDDGDPGNTDGIRRPGDEIPTGAGAIKGPKERDPSALSYYAYNLLSDAEKSVYDSVLESINAFQPQWLPDGVDMTETDMQRIVTYILKDHPEIIWLRHGTLFEFDTATHIVTRLKFTYCLTPAETERRKAEIDSAVSAFLDCVDESMSDYEVALRIYENIIKLADYDTMGLERQRKTVPPADQTDDLRSIYGVMVNKKAVCAGYAKTMQYLLNVCGIECVYVTSDTHAWNLVKLEGDYYHLDVTWGDGSDTKKDKVQSEAINYDCFCITTEEALRLDSHTPEAILPLPQCTAVGCNYHVRHGLYFDSFALDRIKNIVVEQVKEGKTDFSFKFGSAEAYGEAKKSLVDGSKFREAIQYACLKSGVKLDASYKYSVRDDRQVLAFFTTRL